MIRAEDEEYLREHGFSFTFTEDGAGTHVVIGGFALGPGLSPEVTDVLVTLPKGFPDAGPDMFWLSPGATRTSGGGIPATSEIRQHAGRSWQRWSRHIAGQWRPGIDNLGTYLLYVRRCVDIETEVAA